MEEKNSSIIFQQDIQQEQLEDFNLCLLVQVLTRSHFNKKAFGDMMNILWKPSRFLAFKELAEHLFLCQFHNVSDREKVISGAPWHFDRALVLLEEVTDLVLPQQISIKKALFWVQIHNLPLSCMTMQMGSQIGRSLGELVGVDTDEEGKCWGKFIRVRVRIDITKPLRRGMKLQLMNGKYYWVDFCYERLPDFCFVCGILGHTQKDCTMDLDNSTLQYGSWLRAIGLEKARTKRFTVPNYIKEKGSSNFFGTASSSSAKEFTIPPSKPAEIVCETVVAHHSTKHLPHDCQNLHYVAIIQEEGKRLGEVVENVEVSRDRYLNEIEITAISTAEKNPKMLCSDSATVNPISPLAQQIFWGKA